MSNIKAVALTATQSGKYIDVSASVGDYEEDKRYGFRMIWDIEPAPSIHQTTTEWLYTVLCRLVEHYDDHDVVDVKVEGVDLMHEVTKDA